MRNFSSRSFLSNKILDEYLWRKSAWFFSHLYCFYSKQSFFFQLWCPIGFLFTVPPIAAGLRVFRRGKCCLADEWVFTVACSIDSPGTHYVVQIDFWLPPPECPDHRQAQLFLVLTFLKKLRLCSACLSSYIKHDQNGSHVLNFSLVLLVEIKW